MGKDDDTTIGVYDASAPDLCAQYNKLNTEDVLPGLSEHLPKQRALDLGCGSGRDAMWLAQKGFLVAAFDGAPQMVEQAQSLNAHENIDYYVDVIPNLLKTFRRKEKYDFFLLSAVWMHVEPEDRLGLLENIIDLARAGACVYISLRHGTAPKDRPMHDVNAAEIKDYAEGWGGIEFSHISPTKDKMGRSDVWWDYVSLRITEKALTKPRRHG